jgi:hypothetical protein
MSDTTFERRLSQLKAEIMQHPHRDELLILAQEQLVDDTFVLPAACSETH